MTEVRKNGVETNSTSSSSITSDDEGDQQVPTLVFSSRPSILGRIRTISNVKVIEWSFIAISVLSILVGLGFTVYRMSTILPDTDQFVFALLVLINLVFASYYLLHGVFQEQPFEILMYIFTTLILGGLVTLNFTSEEPGTIDRLRLVRFLVTMILSLPNCLIGCTLGWEYWTSGALIFKTVGADMKLQKMCRIYFCGLSLLVFDAQANISCVVLILEKGVSGMSAEEIVILVTGLAFTVIWFIIGYVGMRTENLKVTWLFAVLSIVQPAYALFLFIGGFEQLSGPYSIRTRSAFLAGAILLLAHFTLLATVSVVGSNYGKGLKEAIYGSGSSTNARSRSQERLERHTTVEDSSDISPLIGPGTSQSQNYDTISRVP